MDCAPSECLQGGAGREVCIQGVLEARCLMHFELLHFEYDVTLALGLGVTIGARILQGFQSVKILSFT